MFAEQFFNEKFIVQVLQIGVRVGVEVLVMHWGNEEKFGVLVNMIRENFEEDIEKIMGEGKEVEERREKSQNVCRDDKEGNGRGWIFLPDQHLRFSLLLDDIMKREKRRSNS